MLTKPLSSIERTYDIEFSIFAFENVNGLFLIEVPQFLAKVEEEIAQPALKLLDENRHTSSKGLPGWATIDSSNCILFLFTI